MAEGAARTVLFAGAVCIVCAAVVSASAVLLQDRRQRNAELDERRNVLEVAGLVRHDERIDAAALQERFATVQPTAVEPATEKTADTVAYEVRDEAGALRMVVLPVEGRGLWSTLRGYVCLAGDLNTICGLGFHSHGETPGLGAEIDNPKWKARWVGRRAFDDTGVLRIEVTKGTVGPPEEDPFRVDAISGATITSRGVGDLLRVWLGDGGYGPYLSRLREEGS